MADAPTLCFVFAHPDDETFGVAGTVASYAARGVRSALICVTRGEAGMANGLAASPTDLARVRSGELACAARAMGLDALEIWDYPDGRGEHWDRCVLDEALVRAWLKWRPAVVITFDSEGVTHHPDHVAAHLVTRDLVVRRGPEFGIRRLFYQVVTCPEDASPEGPSLACVPVDQVDVSIDIRAYEAAKRAALLCHRTQATDTAHILSRPVGALGAERYVLAWAGDGASPERGGCDLLAGLSLDASSAKAVTQ
jgi:N-acetylglucosamine malate deacetylase 2